MSRLWTGSGSRRPCFPRVSGDEPLDRPLGRSRLTVFPAGAGMSPSHGQWGPHYPRFPRVSGDEPIGGAGRILADTFSPRERG